ncbi:hypothetical protein KIN52_28945 (plasmid) [Klebsiella pneumoniae]|uniref:hypothetical protein n=1 Tax=Klebsiella pneumoniae TaxID=573 RepID=UPI00227BBBA0|nr:hypothetical protein [Klebsiella pneumoniae]MCY3474824.1 hypothetical protein [Klebsiella pneumoniae]
MGNASLRERLAAYESDRRRVISSFNDVPISATEMRYQGQNFMQALTGAMQGRFSRYTSDEQKEILSSIGVYSDTMRGDNP